MNNKRQIMKVKKSLPLLSGRLLMFWGIGILV